MKLWSLTICCILALGTACFARSNYAVLLEESPVGAGEIKPGIGVHTFNMNEVITLTTVPKRGWRFVYWMGDVSNPTANKTMLSVDGPKIIIAVFQRDAYELPGNDDMAVGAGTERLTRRIDSIGGSGGVSGGGGGKRDDSPMPLLTPATPLLLLPPPDTVPEPQTFIIMTVGIYMSFRKRLLINRHRRK